MFRARRILGRLKQNVKALLVPRREIARWEALGEAAYARMYDARRFEVRECYDEAFQCLEEAIRIARARGFAAEVKRLTARREHIYYVYDHQFRSVF